MINPSSNTSSPVPIPPRQLAKLYGAYVRHPRLIHLLESIDECIEVTREDQESKCMTIIGESGVGKSSLIAQVLKRYPSRDTPTGRITPVLAIDVPKPTSVKGVTTTLLGALGDPQPERGNTVAQTERLYKLIQQCVVEMIILDEFQHLIDEKTDRVLSEVSDFIKTLINRTKISFVLVGMPSLVKILEGPSQIQLRSRFMDRKSLEPFRWLQDDGKDYRLFLSLIESTLPFEKPSNLGDSDTAMRMFVASGGYLRYTMRLIKTAARKTLKTNGSHIDTTCLATAFDAEIGDSGFVKFNPFTAKRARIDAAMLKGVKPTGAAPASNRTKATKADAAETAVLS